jgi:SMC interacting uncharacterized protein involved in chromosome segregation
MSATYNTFETLTKAFIKDMMNRGFDSINNATQGKTMDLDDLFKKFDEFKRKYYDGEVVEPEEEGKVHEVTPDEAKAKYELEISYLKQQVEQLKDQVGSLKQQLKDKEEIIQLLKGVR